VIERERKYRLDAASATRLRSFLEREAQGLRVELQDTTHYIDPSGRLGRLNLRVRTTEDRHELTVKGPRLGSGPSKVREEHTVAVAGDLAPVLEALGLIPAARYRKWTRIYSFRGATVSLDDVADLGPFCEIEASDESLIEQVAAALELRDETREPRGYARLIRAAGPDGSEIEVR